MKESKKILRNILVNEAQWNQHNTWILQNPKSKQSGGSYNQRGTRRFLRLCNYSRGYIPDYVNLTPAPRETMANEGHKNMSAKLHWTPGAYNAFEDHKKPMDSAPSLATPDYTISMLMWWNRRECWMQSWARKVTEKEECRSIIA